MIAVKFVWSRDGLERQFIEIGIPVDVSLSYSFVNVHVLKEKHIRRPFPNRSQAITIYIYDIAIYCKSISVKPKGLWVIAQFVLILLQVILIKFPRQTF